MDLMTLVSFLKICDLNNITHAAQELHITQPALSRRIKQLEEDLGVELLTRDGPRLKVTQAGKMFYYEAKDLIEKENAIREKVRKFQTGVTGTLHLGVSTHVPTVALIPAISEMSRKYLDVKIVIECMSSLNLTRQLMDNRIDIAISMYTDFIGLKGCKIIPIAYYNPAVLVGEAHGYFNKDCIYAEDLIDQDIVLFSDGGTNGTSQNLRLLREQNVKFNSITYCNSFDECVYYVATGKYLSLSSSVPNTIYAGAIGCNIRNIPASLYSNVPEINHRCWCLGYYEDNSPLTELFSEYFIKNPL